MMAITGVDIVKINKYLREHAIGDIYYLDMCDAIGKRGKITDVEFLTYFTDCVLKEFRKDDKISMKLVTKYVSIVKNFLEWIHEEGNEIPEHTLNCIRGFEDFYDEYLNRTGALIDLEFTDRYLNDTLETVNSLYPCSLNGESVSTYINQIAELESQIKVLQHDLDEANRVYGILSNNCSEKDSRIESLTEDYRSKKSETDELKKKVKELTVVRDELLKSTSELQEQIAFLTPYKDKASELGQEVTELRSTVREAQERQIHIDSVEALNSKMEALIYNKLLMEGMSIDKIVAYLKDNGLVTDNANVYQLLSRMKSKINIEHSSFSLSPIYKIVAPKLSSDGNFYIDVPEGCKCYNILLTSDMHIRNLDSKELNGFDMLGDYCARSDIKLILNAGDFFDGIGGQLFDTNMAVENYRIVENAISKIPVIPGVYHAILGGNHEKNISKYGFDPLATFTEAREDFIHLGYEHATISLNGSKSMLGQFDLHHPYSFNFQMSLNNLGGELGILSILNKVYSRQGRSRDDSYVDLIGHAHKNQFNAFAGYYFVPALFNADSSKGACHLRIYLDEETGIKYMVFLPLNVNEKLVRNTEIVYKKMLTK